VEPNPDTYLELQDTKRKAWSIGQCLSSKTTPETVLFDAAGSQGGVIKSRFQTYV